MIILGNGSHARVCKEALRLCGITAEMIRFDIDNLPNGQDYVIGVGDIKLRKRLFEHYKWAEAVVHPSVVAPDPIGAGIQAMAGAVIQPGCLIRDNVIINTGAVVEHDCYIRAHSHIGPGAVLCGTVTVGYEVLVGANATILPGVIIEDHAIIGAGSVVAKYVASREVVAGNPARHVGLNDE